ncbi:MAG: phosphatase PAP2 family protein [Oscillospiraceae bacterium]|nr:phosphatase PAP2 family protein [Oscillospiraceae bacterium]
MDFLYALESARTPFLNGLFSLLTHFGEETVVVVVFCILYWCVDKKLAYGIGVGYFSSALLVQSLKIGCRVERPWVLDPDFQPVESALAHATGYSFPSGHTNSATALYGALALRSKKGWQRAALAAMVALVAFSRMYLGVHTPADVGVGFLLTFAVCLLVYVLEKRCGGTPAYVLGVALILSALCVGAFIFSMSLFNSGLIAEKNAADCFKIAGASLGFAVGYYIERRYIDFSVRCDALWKQAVKLLLGIGGLLALKSGLKPLLGVSPAALALRYFVVILWATVLWPLLIRRFFAKKDDDIA